MKQGISVILLLFFLFGISCTEYTPKPRGYFRIDPLSASYQTLPSDSLPYSFRISQLVTIELPATDDPAGWINLVYPSLGAKIYCSYLPVTRATLHLAEEEARSLVSRQAKHANAIKEKAYSNPDANVYGSLFLLDGESASPIQFMLTDSVSKFFRGALYYDCIPNADSLAPVTAYLQEDIIELIQSFSWNK